MSAGVYVGVAALGAVGSLARVAVDTLVVRRKRTRFPLGTLAVNLNGSLVLGLLTGLAVTGDAILLIGTGLLGSFTTFSTWIAESERIAEGGDPALGAGVVAIALAGGFAAAAAGWAIGAAL